MTPRFALSLSSDGIRLLHRAPDGWDLVGEVPLDAEDLGAAMADLRGDAAKLESGEPTCRVIIPHDQIRFVTLANAQASQSQVETALDGTTPYALHELKIDYIHTGDQTLAAAVALETLEEARTFADEHGFPAACFVAESDVGSHEMFFGHPSGVDGGRTGRETVAPTATGVADLTPAALPEAPEETRDSLPEPNDYVSLPAPGSDAQDDSQPNALPTFTPSARAPSARTGAMAAGALPGGDAPESAKAAPEPPADPADGIGLPVSSASTVTGKSAGSATRATPVGGAPEEPLFTHRKEPPPPARGKGKAAGVDALRTESRPNSPPPSAMAAMAAAPEAPAAAFKGAPTPSPDQVSKPRRTQDDSVAKTAPLGKPRFLGLILTVGLLVILLLVGFWASTLPDEGISWLWGDDDTVEVATASTPQETIAEDVAPALKPQPSDAAEAPSALQESAAADTPALPLVRAPSTGVLSPADADRIYAATGVYQRAPRIPVIPRTTLTEGPRPDSRGPSLPDPVTRPDLPELAVATPDEPLPAQATPPAADLTFARDIRGRILATPDGTVLPSGVIIYAGAPDIRPTVRPGTPDPSPEQVTTQAADPTQPEGVLLIAGRPPVQPQLRPEGLAVSDESRVTPEAIDANETTVIAGAPDQRPLVRPAGLAPVEITTPNPAAVTVVQGAPDRRPGLRPASFGSLFPAIAPPVDPALASARPAVRPDGLAPQDEDTEEVVAEVPEEPQPDINAITVALAAAAAPSSFSNRTSRAVGVTMRPDSRPGNFAQTVSRAVAPTTQRQTGGVVQRPPTEPQVAAPATAAPRGTSAGSVARVATQDNAINMRRINLVGVFGRPNARRALVRLGNGRYIKVEVGSSLDGGRVTAIGDSALNFVKGGRTYALQLPTG